MIEDYFLRFLVKVQCKNCGRVEMELIGSYSDPAIQAPRWKDYIDELNRTAKCCNAPQYEIVKELLP